MLLVIVDETRIGRRCDHAVRAPGNSTVLRVGMQHIDPVGLIRYDREVSQIA